jgi:putative transposase
MLTVTKIRIYPNTKQISAFANAFGCVRWLHNNQLAETQKQYKDTGKGLSQFAMNNRIPQLKQEFEWLNNAHSQVLQAVSLNLSRAFINFFEKRAAFPNFKNKHGKQSIHYPQGVKFIEDRKLCLPKIGHVKAVVHREIVGKIKTCTISKTPTNKYFASILTETNLPELPVSFEGKILGIDVGLTHLAGTSDGSKYSNPKHLKQSEANLAKKQQKLSRKQRGSANRAKARLKVAICHERIANQRKDNLHKLSTRLVNENQVIAVENLAVKNMMGNHKLAKGIADASWGMFTGFLKYKCKKQGKGYIEVDRYFPSTKTCNCCLHVQKLSLEDRFWTCGKCNTYHDRDINASRNIRDEAKRMIAAGSVATAYGGTVSQKKGKIPCFASAVEVGSAVL